MGIHPGPRLLAERLDVKEDEVVEMEQRLGSPDVSVDAPLGGDSTTTLLGVLPAAGVPADEQLAEAELRAHALASIRTFAETLTGKERAVFDRRLMAEDPETLAALGEEFGVTRERVRQIEKRLVDRLRQRVARDLGLDPDEMESGNLIPIRDLP